ncbi:MAG: hypothetical protein EP332_09970 [Bacteroidetes bacterium]|nr:MAG: hypothetical protein EP332_09970 [Bacteroidota bacterium]
MIALFGAYCALSLLPTHAQQSINADSLRKLIRPIQNDSLGYSKAALDSADYYFKLSNTDLGLVVYERNNHPFNLEIHPHLILQLDGFEYYNWQIDSMVITDSLTAYHCTDSIAWTDFHCVFRLYPAKDSNGIQVLTRSLYKKAAGVDLLLVFRTYYTLKFDPKKVYYLLSEPSETPDTSIPFHPINIKQLRLFKE